MTNVITRYYTSAAQARKVRRELIDYQRFPRRIIDIYEDADGLAGKLAPFSVLPETARAYEAKLSQGGGAVLMVLADATPLGVARITREVTAQMGATPVSGVTEEVYVKDPPRQPGKILEGHPHLLTRRLDADRSNYHMADWPLPLTNRRKPFTASLLPPHGHMANWPIGLISRRKPYTGSIFGRHARMASFPIPLLSRRKPFDGFAFPRHKRMANFPIPLLSRRKPYTGSIIARHARMANWPFPHLINGKTGTNALMPGGPRMANFPIPLISKRKPYTGSAIPRHGRMANFPIPLLSRRKPYDGFAIPRHGRMADAILPLVIKHGEDRPREGFSLSKMLGWSTIIRR